MHRTLPAVILALSSSAQQESPVFRTGTEIVEIPAVVRDSRGADVEGLRLEDFQVREDGQPRIITHFSVERRKGSTPIPDQYVIYVFDDLHLSFSDLASARASFERHLEGTDLGGRRVAVASTSGSVTLPFSADRAALMEAARRIRPAATTYNGNECPSVTHYVADQMENKRDRGALATVVLQISRCMGPMPQALAEQIARTEAQRVLRIEHNKGKATVALLNREIERASRMPGDRHLVLLSSGFHVAEQREKLTAAFERAARNRVAISAVNAHGVDTTANIQAVRGLRSSADILAAAADLTGGVYVANSNDTEQGLRRVAEPPRVVYVLGFVPESDRPAGEYHKLEVRVVGKRGVKVQARRGYLTRRSTGEQEAVHSALFSQSDAIGIPLEIAADCEADGRVRVIAKVWAQGLPFRRNDSRHTNVLTIVYAMFDSNGNLVNETTRRAEMRLDDAALAKLQDQGLQLGADFAASPGTYMVRVVVREAETGKVSASGRMVTVPRV